LPSTIRVGRGTRDGAADGAGDSGETGRQPAAGIYNNTPRKNVKSFRAIRPTQRVALISISLVLSQTLVYTV